MICSCYQCYVNTFKPIKKKIVYSYNFRILYYYWLVTLLIDTIAQFARYYCVLWYGKKVDLRIPGKKIFLDADDGKEKMSQTIFGFVLPKTFYCTIIVLCTTVLWWWCTSTVLLVYLYQYWCLVVYHHLEAWILK